MRPSRRRHSAYRSRASTRRAMTSGETYSPHSASAGLTTSSRRRSKALRIVPVAPFSAELGLKTFRILTKSAPRSEPWSSARRRARRMASWKPVQPPGGASGGTAAAALSRKVETWPRAVEKSGSDRQMPGAMSTSEFSQTVWKPCLRSSSEIPSSISRASRGSEDRKRLSVKRSHASRRAAPSSGSSISTKPGSTPASTGRSRSRRAPKAWIVPMKQESMCATILSTRLRVLPVPADASTRIVVSRSSRIAARAPSSGRTAGGGGLVRFFGMELSKFCEDSMVVSGELLTRPGARRLRAAADRLEDAELAVLGREGMREHSRREEVEEAAEDLARLRAVERREHALSLPLPAGEEIAGLRYRSGPPRPIEQGLEGHRIERRLDLATAPQARPLPDAQRGARLVVPDVERAVGGLVHAVDRAAQEEAPAAPDLDRDGIAAGDERARPGRLAGKAERHFEVARSDVAAMFLLAREKCAAGEADVLALQREGELALRRDPVLPCRDSFFRQFQDQSEVPLRTRFLAGFGDSLEEVPKHLVEEASLRHGVEPARGIALEVLGRFDVKHVTHEVGEGAFGQILEAGRRERLTAPAGIQLRRAAPDPAVPDGEFAARPGLVRAVTVFEPRIGGANGRREAGVPSRRVGVPEAGEPPLRVVQRGFLARGKARGPRECPGQIGVVRLGMARTLAVQIEEGGGGGGLTRLRKVAQVEARIARRQFAAQSPEAGPERRRGFARPIAPEGEECAGRFLVDAPAFFVQEDGIFEIGSRHVSLVQPDEERVPAPREAACTVVGNVSPSGARTVGGDRETDDGIPETLDGRGDRQTHGQ